MILERKAMSNPTEELKPCPHPSRQLEDYHDGAVICNQCGCVVEQYGKPIENPQPLFPIPQNTRADDWLPIEDAPKDGTEFLAWNGHCRKVTHWNEARGKFIGFECLVAPTHFRHLPQPPKEEG